RDERVEVREMGGTGEDGGAGWLGAALTTPLPIIPASPASPTLALAPISRIPPAASAALPRLPARPCREASVLPPLFRRLARSGARGAVFEVGRKGNVGGKDERRRGEEGGGILEAVRL
ncbi:unnamed protein product, partial [Closterium sp. Naga37s-1]